MHHFGNWSWSQDPGTLRVVARSVTVAALAVGTATACVYHLISEARSVAQRQPVVVAVASRDGVPDSQALRGRSRDDFTASLPAALALEDAARDATAWSSKFALTQRQLTLHSKPATPGDLQRGDIEVEIEGAYPQLKLWMRELLSRYSHLTIVRLDIRPQSSGPDGRVVALIGMRAFARPGPTSLQQGLTSSSSALP